MSASPTQNTNKKYHGISPLNTMILSTNNSNTNIMTMDLYTQLQQICFVYQRHQSYMKSCVHKIKNTMVPQIQRH